MSIYIQSVLFFDWQLCQALGTHLLFLLTLTFSRLINNVLSQHKISSSRRWTSASVGRFENGVKNN